MKSMTIFIALLIFSSHLFAEEFNCLKKANFNYQLPHSLEFEVLGCSPEDTVEELKKHLLNKRGEDAYYVWHRADLTSWESAEELLRTDHTPGDASPPYTEEEIDKVREFYFRPENYQEAFSELIFCDSVEAASAVSAYLVFFNTVLNEMVLVEKYIYEE